MYSEKLSIVKQSLGSYYESNDEMLLFCPKCNHHKRKLSVNINKNVFKCWICDFKGNDLYPIIKDRNLKQKWNAAVANDDLDITVRYGNVGNYAWNNYSTSGKSAGYRGNAPSPTKNADIYKESFNTLTDAEKQYIREYVHIRNSR